MIFGKDNIKGLVIVVVFCVTRGLAVAQIMRSSSSVIGPACTLFSPFLRLLEGFSPALVGTFLNMTFDDLFFFPL